MLENINQDLIKDLQTREGEEIEEIKICEVAKNSIIRVITFSGNVYFFEIIVPNILLAHVYRCQSRQFAPQTGYRGKRKVTSVFKVGEQIFHNNSQTSPVKKMNLLK